VAKPQVVLRKGQGKDGDPNFSWYVKKYPTHYNWRGDIEKLTHRLVNMDPFYKKIWVNTYYLHPPPFPQPTVSFDVWGFGGRGDSLDVNLGWKVRQMLFKDKKQPNIWWMIWQGKEWRNGFGERAAPWGPKGSDPDHLTHIHVTYL
jgi:hypothetical protein